jgi:hypothetical protein
VKGLSARHAVPEHRPRVRGAITHDIVRRIVKHKTIVDAGYSDGFIFQQAFGLRNRQVCEARVGNLHRGVDAAGKTEYLFVCPSGKRRAFAPLDFVETHRSRPEWDEDMERIYNAIAERKNNAPDDLVFAFWKTNRASNLVTAAAKALGLDPCLVWVNHGFRHGASLDAANNAADQSVAGRLEAASQHLCHKETKVTESFYLIEPVVRQVKAQAVLMKEGVYELSRGKSDFLVKVNRHGAVRVERIGFTKGQSRQSILRAKKVSAAQYKKAGAGKKKR